MRVGIAGAGFMGSTHAAAWAATPATLTGIVAETTSEAEGLAAQFGARAYPSFAALLAEVDVVDICTPTHLHHPLVLEAATAGKHVVCEKPLARTLEQAQQMVRACRAAGVKLLPAQVVRFFPEYALAKATVDTGQIGRLAIVRLARCSYRPKKPTGNWFLDFDKSGGMLLDMLVHDFDYARWVAGEVHSVFARSVSAIEPGSPVEYSLAILRHAGGALTHVAGAWAYPPPTFRTGLEIAGDRGLIEFDSDATAPIRTLLQQPGGSAPDVGLPASPLRESPFVTEMREFYEAIAHDRPARVSAADGLAAVQIGLAAIQSAQSGEPVFLSRLPELAS